jgi:hypothetical protein
VANTTYRQTVADFRCGIAYRRDLDSRIADVHRDVLNYGTPIGTLGKQFRENQGQ